MLGNQIGRRMLSLNKQIGVTIVELLVAIAVVAILASIAVPNMGGMLATNRLNDAQENIMQVLKSAHANAVAKGTFVTVTITSASRTLSTSYGNGGTAPPNLVLNSDVAIAADDTLIFSPNGTVDAAGTVTLSSVNHTSLPSRGISITVTGLITATR